MIYVIGYIACMFIMAFILGACGWDYEENGNSIYMCILWPITLFALLVFACFELGKKASRTKK